jgi:hypothetical protein
VRAWLTEHGGRPDLGRGGRGPRRPTRARPRRADLPIRPGRVHCGSRTAGCCRRAPRIQGAITREQLAAVRPPWWLSSARPWPGEPAGVADRVAVGQRSAFSVKTRRCVLLRQRVLKVGGREQPGHGGSSAGERPDRLMPSATHEPRGCHPGHPGPARIGTGDRAALDRDRRSWAANVRLASRVNDGGDVGAGEPTSGEVGRVPVPVPTAARARGSGAAGRIRAGGTG